MAIAVWFLDIVAYMAYMIYMFGRPADLFLGLGLAALIIGFLGLVLSKKLVMLSSFVFLLGGVAFTYLTALHRGQLYIWAAAMAAMLFFGSLALRED